MFQKILLHIICYDIWFYFSHIILHTKNIYSIHKIHHSVPYQELTYMDTHRAHWIENIVQNLGLYIPCFFEFSIYPIITSFTIISIRGMMRHDDRCSGLIGNHHILHHKYRNYNFGEHWIDSLFGTTYPDKKEYIYGKIYT